MAMGRPVEFDQDRVLEAAMQLFWHKGYEATSVGDLQRAMGLSKSSLYQAFGSKHALFEQCIGRYRAGLVADMQSSLATARSGRRFIEQVFFGVADETKHTARRRGCLVMNTASEFAQRDPAIARLVTASTRAFTEAFAAAVTRAQREGEITAEKDPKLLARYLVSSMAGLRTMVKAGASARSVRDIARVILEALD
jgi:TetR/AcrR family transcriptional repressor of nem operon